MALALVGGGLIAVDQHNFDPCQSTHISNARAHKTGAEDADLLDRSRRNVFRPARALVQFAHRDEQRTHHRRRLRRTQDLDEPAAFDAQSEVHRQLQAFIDRLQNGARGRVIVESLAAVDGVGRRPDHHAAGRKNLARRRLPALNIPGRDALAASLDPFLGLGHDFRARREGVDEVLGLGGGRLDLVALEQHLQGVGRRHQSRNAGGAAGAGKQADLDFGQADPGFVVIRHDAIMAGQRQFEAAAEAGAVDGDGPGFSASLDLAVDARKL